MRIKVLLILLLLLPVLVLPAAADVREEQEIIRDILVWYSHHQSAAETDLIRLLEELEQVNPESARDWKGIVQTWHSLSEMSPTCDKVLPDGLPQDDSLCIVVMGFQLGYGGGMQPELIHRLEVALASAEKYPNAYLLCTGGGTARGSHATEAGQMIYWLKENGVAPERLIRESRSISTEQNALYSLQLLRESYPQVTRIALISSDYHLRRCCLLFDAVLRLNDWDDHCQIAATAGCREPFFGFGEGYFEEAENLSKYAGMVVKNTRAPTLSVLTEILPDGPVQYLQGEPLALTLQGVYDNGFHRDVTERMVITNLDPSLLGDQQITVVYTENGISLQVAVQITILPLPTTLPPATAPEVTEAAVPPMPES